MADSSEITVRPASFSDLDDLAALLGELFSIEDDFDFDVKLQRQGLSMMLSDTDTRCVLVAEADRKAVGMCTLQTLISTAEGGEVGLVEDVVVNEQFRGRGIGRLLLATMENWAREKGLKRLQLLADRNNASGLCFYKKMNWKTTSLICLRKKGRL